MSILPSNLQNQGNSSQNAKEDILRSRKDTKIHTETQENLNSYINPKNKAGDTTVSYSSDIELKQVDIGLKWTGRQMEH